jgi:hypothetical protein
VVPDAVAANENASAWPANTKSRWDSTEASPSNEGVLALSVVDAADLVIAELFVAFVTRR